MHFLRLILCLLLLTGAACRKRRGEAAAAPGAGSPPAPGNPAGPVAAEPPKEVPVETALHHLNTAARNYYADKFKLPASLDELYQAGYLKEHFIPPAGRQFFINPQTQAVEVR